MEEFAARTKAPARDSAEVTARRRSALVVGAADDRSEVEADRVADHVTAALRSPGPPRAQRSATTDDRIRRNAFAGPDGGAVDRDTESKIQAARGGGSAIAPDVAQRFGSAMGADLSGVRIHRGPQSDSLNQQLGARAFTIGRDVFMSNSAPDTGTRAGDHLLAHELTHVVQQSGGSR